MSATVALVLSEGAPGSSPRVTAGSAKVQMSPSPRSARASAVAPRRVATIFTCPVEGWLKEETIITGPPKALVSSDRSSLRGSSAPSSERTTVRASGRVTVWRALPTTSMRETPPAWVNFTSLIRARPEVARGVAATVAAGGGCTGAAAGATTGAAAGFVRLAAVAAATADGVGLDGAGVAAPRGVTAMPPATRFTW